MPGEFRAPKRIETMLARIQRDRRSGAGELAVRVIELFESARPAHGVTRAQYERELRRLVRRVQALRPSMAPIGNVASRLGEAATGADAEACYAELSRAAARMRADLDGLPDRALLHLRRSFPRIRRPLLISYSSLVTAVLRRWPRRRLHVTVCESRPGLEGRRTASLLARRAASVAVVTDAQAGLALETCDSVIMGCDAVFDDGSVVNKAGSYLLALAARRKGRPVIVLGDTLKLAGPTAWSHESQPPRDVWRRPSAGVVVRNVVFETVPADCIDRIVLETGTYRPRDVRRLWGRGKK